MNCEIYNTYDIWCHSFFSSNSETLTSLPFNESQRLFGRPRTCSSLCQPPLSLFSEPNAFTHPFFSFICKHCRSYFLEVQWSTVILSKFPLRHRRNTPIHIKNIPLALFIKKPFSSLSSSCAQKETCHCVPTSLLLLSRVFSNVLLKYRNFSMFCSHPQNTWSVQLPATQGLLSYKLLLSMEDVT